MKIPAKATSGKKILPMVLSIGGFTDDTPEYCKEHGIGPVERITVY